jgi:molybdate transport system regulatory protein
MLKQTNWSLKSKIWLEIQGQPVIGEGRMAMLQAIHLKNSIMQASHETGISYRRIRGAIQDMENAIGQPLVHARRGGREGGGAELTPLALDLSRIFSQLSDGFKKEVDARLRNINV